MSGELILKSSLGLDSVASERMHLPHCFLLPADGSLARVLSPPSSGEDLCPQPMEDPPKVHTGCAMRVGSALQPRGWQAGGFQGAPSCQLCLLLRKQDELDVRSVNSSGLAVYYFIEPKPICQNSPNIAKFPDALTRTHTSIFMWLWLCLPSSLLPCSVVSFLQCHPLSSPRCYLPPCPSLLGSTLPHSRY